MCSDTNKSFSVATLPRQRFVPANSRAACHMCPQQCDVLQAVLHIATTDMMGNALG